MRNRFKRFLARLMIFVTIATSSNMNVYAIHLPGLSKGSGAEQTGDRYDKSNTITGIIYNELRAKELDWAEEIRNYGTTETEDDTTLDINQLLFTERAVNARQYASSGVGKEDLLGPWTVVEDENPELVEFLDQSASFVDKTATDFKNFVNDFLSSHGLRTIGEGEDIEAAEDLLKTLTKSYEGILAPEPFREAEYKDYKILQTVDVGNELELRGKPQEGFTSNAKQITAMASVFYQQQVDELTEAISSDRKLTSAFAAAKYAWKMAWTKAETHHIPFLAEIAVVTGWSWTSTYRTYAYPLLEASHQTNFFLSSYIYPTKWTKPEGSWSISEYSHWDGHLGGDESSGNQEVKVQQASSSEAFGEHSEFASLQEAKNGRLGTPKESGSGKVTAKSYVSNETYQGQGDSAWEAIEMCPSHTYGDYGCQLRYRFYYKWPARDGRYSWTVDEENNVITEGGVDHYNTNMYYGENPDGTTPVLDVGVEADPNTVAADVSPWHDSLSEAQRYHPDNCLIHFLNLRDKAGVSSYCWYNDDEELGPINEPELKEEFPGGDGSLDFETETDFLCKEAGALKSRRIAKALRLIGFEKKYKYIQQIKIDETGVNVWVSEDGPRMKTVVDQEEVQEVSHTDPETGSKVIDVPYQERKTHEEKLDWRVPGAKYHFTHVCLGLHEGTYCGGHLQLRTRGVVYGFSEQQMDEATIISDRTNNVAVFTPKFIDPDPLAIEKEQQLYPDLTVFNVDEYSSDKARVRDSEDATKLVEAEDIFDIDVNIKRKKSVYPGYGGEGGAFEQWKSWTMTNMLNAISLACSDWSDTFNLVDTQTAAGGIYVKSSGDDLTTINALNDSVKKQIMYELGENDVNMAADLISEPKEDEPPTLNPDGTEMSDEDKKLVYRLRHVNYALNTVGKVGYAQTRHDGMYENIAGRATDCSGYVSNIWRDVFDTSLTTSGLKAIAQSKGALHTYMGPGTAGIDPGDIILRNPDGDDGHALVYIGEFDSGILYSIDKDQGEINYTPTGDKKVFTVDCSSMVFNAEDLPDDKTPVAGLIEKAGRFASGLVQAIKNKVTGSTGSNLEKVRAGNTRFAARTYCQEPSGNMYYIDMDMLVGDNFSTVKSNGRYMKAYDFTKLCLRNSTEDYWHSYATTSDVSEARGILTVEYDDDLIALLKKRRKLSDEFVNVPEEDPEMDPYNPGDDEPIDPNYAPGVRHEDDKVWLEIQQYICQYKLNGYLGPDAYSANPTKSKKFSAIGCCASSYMMAVAYLTGKQFNDPVRTANNYLVPGTRMFDYSRFLSANGCSSNNSSYPSYKRSTVKNAINSGKPVILWIEGYLDFHNTPNGHFLVITGYNQNGYTVHDPGNEWNNNKTISYSSIENHLNQINGINVVSN